MVIWKTSPQTIIYSSITLLHILIGCLLQTQSLRNSCIKCLTCFSFFHNKFLPLLNNVNYEVSSTEKDYFASMMASVSKISNYVIHYASHHLGANVKFSAIEKNIQSMKIDPSIVYMVPYHNQKVLHMMYHELQVD